MCRQSESSFSDKNKFYVELNELTIKVILINQSISVSSQTQFFENVSSKSVVKSNLGKFFLDEWNNLP